MSMVSIQRISAVVYRDIIIMKRNLFRFFDLTLWPLILFLSLTLFVAYVEDDPVILGVVVLGVTGWRAVYHAEIEFAQHYLDEHWSGMLGHYLVSPITLVEMIIGNVIVGISKFIIVAAGYFFLAKIMFNFTVINWPLVILGLIVLTIFGIIIGLFSLGICFIYHENAFAVSYILPDLLVLASGVYYPITVFPIMMQKVIHFIPAYYGFEILKASLGAGTVMLPELIATTLLWLVGGIMFLEATKRYAMRKGLFAKLN